MSGVTALARQNIAPRPTPGKTATLLACENRYVRPPYSHGAKGLPVATKARPSLQANRSAGTASQFAVGLDIGRMMGWSQYSTIARTIRSSIVPGCPDRP